jgi:hypothetical protein
VVHRGVAVVDANAVDACRRASEAWAYDSPKDYHPSYRYRSQCLHLDLDLHLVLLMLEAAGEEDPETGHWRAGDCGDDVACAGAGDVACDAVAVAVVGEFVPPVDPTGWRSVAAAVAGSDSDFASDVDVDADADSKKDAVARVDSALGDAWWKLELEHWKQP